jgi:hypothetical protein
MNMSPSVSFQNFGAHTEDIQYNHSKKGTNYIKGDHVINKK